VYVAGGEEANLESEDMAKPTRQQLTSLVQYVIMRGDLVDKWPLGASIAQACHASTAALHIFRDDPATLSYLEDLDSMHKVVLRVRAVHTFSHVWMHHNYRNSYVGAIEIFTSPSWDMIGRLHA